MEEEENLFSCTPDIVETAETITLDSLPEKSRLLYEKEYTAFTEWCKTKNVEEFSEDVLMEYFLDKSKKYKPSSLSTYYCMLKGTLSVKHNIDISKFDKLITFLKSKSENDKPKETKILTTDQIETFIREAPDKIYLMTKVALIIGIAGGCRREELTMLTVDDIEDLNSALIIKLREGKTKISRTFTVVNDNEDFIGVYRKYAALRPRGTDHRRFFVCYKEGKCTIQPVGKNTFGLIPAKVAEYLKLPDPSSYTGHCFRRSSVLSKMKRRRGWMSSAVVEEYYEDSIPNETSTVLASTSKVDQCEQNDIGIQCSLPLKCTFPVVYFNNSNNCKVDVYLHNFQ